MDKAETSLRLNQKEESFDPKGHPALVFIEGNLFRNSKGDILRSEWPLGSEPYHKDLFIEYERTFGRGLAKDLSHGLGFSKIPSNLKPVIKDLQSEYQNFAKNIQRLSLLGSEDEVREEIEKIKTYRAKYPDLYKDVDKPVAFKIKFEKIS